MLLNDYLNIQNYGSKEFEYKITFKDEAKFYQDVKNQKQIFIRISHKDYAPITRKGSPIRRHCQVYLDSNKFHW